jgi:2,5-dihydroxypyridine 5,6-dioxygenase
MEGTFSQQRRYFPTAARAALTLRAVEIAHKASELRVTSDSGTNFRARKVGRPGHAQYGIADVPGRWDNFGYGCVVISPEEYAADGVVVLQPGDMVQSYPGTLPDKEMPVSQEVRFTFSGVYVTKIDGGADAKRFEKILKSFNNKEAFGISHLGFGTHENTDINDAGFHHHNKIGSILFSVGANHGHGLGGPELKYSGMGPTTRKAPNHSHFAVYAQNFFCDGRQIIERGKLLL